MSLMSRAGEKRTIGSVSGRETMMSTLTSHSETIDERVDRLVQSHSEHWPPLHSTPTHSAIEEIIGRVAGLEAAVHEIALELRKLASERDSREAHLTDE
jgi:hypothetical protein